VKQGSKILLGLLGVAGMAMAAPLNVAGNTNGSTSSMLGGTNGGVTFSPTTFSASVTNGGPAVTKTIGTFDSYCTGIPGTCNGLDTFDLSVTFTAPTGVDGSPASYTAIIGGNLLDFDSSYALVFGDPTQTFTFDNGTINGTITFTVDEPNWAPVVGNYINLNDGSGRYVKVDKKYTYEFTPGQTYLNADVSAVWTTDAVPEPTSVILLGTLLCGVGYCFRKKFA
jgi:hypothetical protein